MFKVKNLNFNLLNLTIVPVTVVTIVIGLLFVFWQIQQGKISYLQQQIEFLQIESLQIAPKDYITLKKDQILLENAINGTVIQALGGAFFFVTAFFTWRNLKATETKQMTESFSKAIEHLGSEQIAVRTGGVYALEMIAKDSIKYHWSIIELLTSFVRENSPLVLNRNQEVECKKISNDVQVALRVIGQRDFHKDPVDKKLLLSYTNLSGAQLNKACLIGAVLLAANISKAGLFEINLNQAVLCVANFSETTIYKSHLAEVNLTMADLSKTYIVESDMSGANLDCANLCEAKLTQTNLKEANLSGADLNGANLKGTLNLTPQQVKAAKNWEKADYDDEFRRILSLPLKPINKE